MTKEEILAMEAGRKLDKLVHEDVMKQCWHDWVAEQSDSNVTGVICSKCRSKPIYGQGMVNYPLYSMDISAAWQVVEKMLSEGWYWFAYSRKELSIELNGCQFAKEPFIKDNIDFLVDKIVDGKFQMPEAICKAALLTKVKQ